ncbi:MAG TPA: hypothetical protein VKA13_01705, partial [Gammaproteobacteria bacterium]|nr:hypothetical protein [Gammaproteobacteria bacterium]
MQAVLRRLWKLLWLCFAWVTIVAAVLSVTARLLLPLAGHYRTDIVQAVEQSLGRAIHVEALKPEWRGFGPVIVLQGVQLLSEPGGRPVLSFNRARLGIDLWSSLLHRRLEGSHLTVMGVAITLVRHRDGRLGIEGFGSVATGGARGRENLDKAQAWLEAQRQVTIADSDIYWHDVSRGGAPLHFAHVSLTLANRGQRHQVSGSALLPAAMGRTLNLALSIQGPLLHLERWTGDLYVKGAGLRLPGPFGRRDYGGITLGDGLADLRAWGRIDGGALRDLEGEAQVDALQLDSAAAQDDGRGGDRPPALKLKALGARFHWRRHGHGWILDADRVWLSQGGEVTPRTQVRVSTRWDPDQSEIDAQIGYMRLEDAAALARLSDAAAPAV